MSLSSRDLIAALALGTIVHRAATVDGTEASSRDHCKGMPVAPGSAEAADGGHLVNTEKHSVGGRLNAIVTRRVPQM